jgi:hypothetical protein
LIGYFEEHFLGKVLSFGLSYEAGEVGEDLRTVIFS